MPASEELICWSVAHLQLSGMRHRTCCSYVVAMWAHHIEPGVAWGLNGDHLCLSAVLKRVKGKDVLDEMAKRVHRPVTANVLNQLQLVWSNGGSVVDEAMYGLLAVSVSSAPCGLASLHCLWRENLIWQCMWMSLI